jgi:hypothetical protein
MAIELGGSGQGKVPKRGARPTPRNVLAAATPHSEAGLAAAPPNFITIPHKLSSWGNLDHGDCVTAEEAFAKACHKPEIFIADTEVIRWAKKHGVLEGAFLHQVMVWMQGDGFHQGGHVYDDGPKIYSVDWKTSSTLNSAIAQGPVKIGVAATQLETAWRSTNSKTGWFGLAFNEDTNEDHCVSLCGYGSLNWLAQQLQATVPTGADGTKLGYALFTWDTIGIIDQPSMIAITQEAWLRAPTTVIKPAKTPEREKATA